MILAEIALLLLIAMLGCWGALTALSAGLAAAALRGQSGDIAAVEAAAEGGLVWFAGGIVLVAAVRAISSRRSPRTIRTPLLLPAGYAAVALGMCVQYGYGSPFSSAWNGPAFAQGVGFGSAIAAVFLVIPGDLPGWLHRGRPALAAAVVGLFAALSIWGTAPGASDQRINLWGVQPIEAVKIAAVLFLGSYLGQRAAKLRYQREKTPFLPALMLPRPRLLLPALLALATTLLGMLFVRDLGPTLILGAVFLGMFYVVTRSPGWVGLAGGLGISLLAILGLWPDLAPSTSVEIRLRMWVDPWFNALENGDQLALCYWTMAAGGMTGTGIGSGLPGSLPAGHTDLAFAHLVEELGLAGGGLYLLLLGAAITDGLRVAAWNRTPERVMMAAGLALLLAAQALTILGGTLGMFPLTGVVVPFLSYGKSGMAAFLGLIALIARLGENGEVVADTDELRELRGGVRRVQVAVAAGCLLLLWATGWRALWDRDGVTLHPAITTLDDGTPRLIADPRLRALAAGIRRGPILDRNGEILAFTDEAGVRSYPLGSALGTLLGPPEGGLLRPSWSTERLHDGALRGYPDLERGPAAWLARAGTPEAPEGPERLVHAAAADLPAEAAEAARRAQDRGLGGPIRRIQMTAPDYRGLLPMARMPLAARLEAIQALSLDLAPRTVRLTLDAKLQGALAAQVKQAAARSKVGAAAAVLIDPQTGQILARAQWPDYDPAGDTWKALRMKGDPQFMGIYGAWSDKTGIHGVFQAGSVFKILSATVAVREGLAKSTVAPDDGQGSAPATCPATSTPTFDCSQRDAGRASFTLPGWATPIHDHGDAGSAGGKLDLVAAITHSSNVWFGQLALALGPLPYRSLREAGVEFGNPGLLTEVESPWTGLGSPGSRRLALTGFGQGAGSWSPVQAARLLGVIASGGFYRRCAPDMQLEDPCTSVPILPDGADVSAILAGMQGVMQRGTGASLAKKYPVPGVRVYGKTGTADAPGTEDEAAYGIRKGQQGLAPHSWFVAIAEPSSAPACGDAQPDDLAGRYVLAAVVPHGGYGAAAAGPLVMGMVRSMQSLGYLPDGTKDGKQTP